MHAASATASLIQAMSHDCPVDGAWLLTEGSSLGSLLVQISLERCWEHRITRQSIPQTRNMAPPELTHGYAVISSMSMDQIWFGRGVLSSPMDPPGASQDPSKTSWRLPWLEIWMRPSAPASLARLSANLDGSEKRKFSYASNVQQWRIRHLVASGLTDMGAPENSLKWSEQPAFKIWANAESRHTFFDLPPRAVLHPRRQGPG